MLLFPIFLFYWWVHFPRSVPFCQPRQQLFAHSWDCACSSFSPASIQALKLKGNGSEGTWRGHSNRNRIKNICPAVFHRISYPSCSKLMFESHENVTGSAAILCPTVYSWHKQSRKCGRSMKQPRTFSAWCWWRVNQHGYTLRSTGLNKERTSFACLWLRVARVTEWSMQMKYLHIFCFQANLQLPFRSTLRFGCLESPVPSVDHSLV